MVVGERAVERQLLFFRFPGEFSEICSRINRPDSCRSASDHPPLELALDRSIEQVAFLSATDQVSQLICRACIQSIHRCHSALSSGPSPVACMPADLDTNV